MIKLHNRLEEKCFEELENILTPTEPDKNRTTKIIAMIVVICAVIFFVVLFTVNQ